MEAEGKALTVISDEFGALFFCLILFFWSSTFNFGEREREREFCRLARRRENVRVSDKGCPNLFR